MSSSPSLPTVNIGTSQIANGINGSQTASSILQLYTNTVLTTPTFSIPSVVDQLSNSNVSTQLPADQATARRWYDVYPNSHVPVVPDPGGAFQYQLNPAGFPTFYLLNDKSQLTGWGDPVSLAGALDALPFPSDGEE